MYRLTWDMTPQTMVNIDSIIKTNGVPNIIVEVGAYEGHTTFTMSDSYTKFNPDLVIYTIDPHVNSVEIPDYPKYLYDNFMFNLQECKQKNVKYIRKYSEDALIELIVQGITPEFIYIDGDHQASTVLTDLTLSFKMIKTGGIILCDDATDWKYTDKNGTASVQMSPRLAIETFIACNWHKLEIIKLPNMGQTAFRKLC